MLSILPESCASGRGVATTPAPGCRGRADRLRGCPSASRPIRSAVDAVGLVDEQHAGLHAANDQFVDLREIGQVDAALFRERFGFADVLAENETQRSRTRNKLAP